MAGFLQVGDFINFGKLAWQVYEYGWREEFNATKQYLEFGNDIKGLALNLDILSRVWRQANNSLLEQGAFNASPRWDQYSLLEIIGDYEETLGECCALVKDNRRYQSSTVPIKNIEWNMLVQPNAERLRRRLLLHNSKVLLVLKPFEIDLLCRVRQDIQRMHQDLVHRIQAVHLDVRHLMGVLISDLEQTLAQQENRALYVLDIPPQIAEGFRRAALKDRPEYQDDTTFDLEEIADAFVLHYKESTVDFTAGILIENKTPPTNQYINLLKCVWLMRRIQESARLKEAHDDSHWPSYIRQLEDDLSSQCERFDPKQELIVPSTADLRPHDLEIWPEKEPLQLVDIVTKTELMEQVLEVPLSSAASNVQRKLQLLRRTGTDGKRFRVNISGAEQTSTGKMRTQVETIDFDLSSAAINPLYALPSSPRGLDVILRKDERIAKLDFMKLKDVLKFQQAITGFKPWLGYSQHNATVSFILSGCSEPIIEEACVQLWIPKIVDGSLVTSSDAAAAAEQSQSTRPSRSTTVDSSFFDPIPFTTPGYQGLAARSNPLGIRGTSMGSVSLPSPPQPIPGSSRCSTSMSQRQPVPIPGRPVQSSSNGGFFTGSPRQSSLPLSPPTSPPNPNQFPLRWSPVQPSPPPNRSPARDSLSTLDSRTFSVSTNTSATAPSNTSSSGSDAHTVTLTLGGNSVGTLHRRPLRPMLVLFTRNSKSGKLSFVTIPLDEHTNINPSRCRCARSGRDGAPCNIASLECREGRSDIEARRFESHDGEAEWNMARLAQGRREERGYTTAAWKGLRRVSIMFPDAKARAKFSGTPNICKCPNQVEAELAKCLEQGHKGLMGEVQEWHRREGNRYHQTRYGSMRQVVNGPPGTFAS